MIDRAIAVCRDCRQGVRWTITPNGKRLAVDPHPDPTGNVAAYRDHLGAWRSRVLHKGERPAPHERPYMPHVATCKGRQPTPVLPAGVASLTAWRTRRSAR